MEGEEVRDEAATVEQVQFEGDHREIYILALLQGSKGGEDASGG